MSEQNHHSPPDDDASEWLPLTQAARRLDLNIKTLDGRGRRGTAARKRAEGARGWLYKVPALHSSTPSHPSPSYIRRKSYLYDVEREVYILNVKGQPGPVLLDAAKVRAIQAHYTAVRSIDETCREFELTREVFEALKRSLELTQGSHPLTREEVRETDLPDLILRVGEVEEAQKYAKLEKDKWKMAMRDALKWRDIKRTLVDHLKDIEWTQQPAAQPQPPSHNTVVRSPHTILLGTTDFHVGKRAFGDEGSVRAYEDHLFEMCARAIKEALVWGAPRRWVLLVGSDLLHCDTLSLTTTKGTPQGAQSVGSIFQHFDSACRLMARVIEEASPHAPVHALWLPGNHDEVLSFAVACALRERYRDTPRVTVDLREDSRRVLAVGKVPILFTHGHHLKPKDYVPILAREIPSTCDIKLGLVIQGHLHTHRRQSEDEYVGVQTITLASPAPADDWHHHKGYGLTRKQMSVLRIDEERGLDTVLLVSAARPNTKEHTS